MNRKFISKSNRILRKVLNSKDNLDIIKDFIESFLDLKIKSINLNPYLKIKSKNLPSEENFGIVDVRVKLEDKRELNIGIQFVDGYYIQNKILLYYAQIHANQLCYADKRKFVNTITINLLDLNYLNSKDYFNQISIPSNPKENVIELYIVELPKFHNTLNIEDKKSAWMTYLKRRKSYFNKKSTKK